MWWRRRREEDLERELRSHLDLESEEQGDVHAAKRAFGNIARTKGDTRSAWGWTWVETVAQDFRYALRNLRKKPGFAIVAIVSLALGIGASTAIFTVVNSVLLRPMPYPESERLVRLWETLPKKSFYRNVINGWNLVEWRQRTQSFEAIAAMSEVKANLTAQGEPVSVPAMSVSGTFFPILRVPPLLGRTLTVEDEAPGHDRVVVLSYGLWQSSFGGDRAVIGKQVDLFGAASTVVGVMPAGFSFPNSRAQLWMPLLVDRSKRWEGGRGLISVARLKPGITLARAGDDLTRVAGQLAVERADYDQGWGAEAIPLLADTTGSVRIALLVLMGAVGFLLAIACANVANLFVMRGAERYQEIALRETLGASKARVFRQYLTESLAITSIAAAAGLVAGEFGLRAMLSLLPPSATLPRAGSIELDARVFVLALAVAAFTAILFGLVPLIQRDRVDLQKTLRARSQAAGKGFRYVFVTTQVAMALTLLAGAGLMARSFSRLIAVDPGFNSSRLLAMDVFAAGRFPSGRVRSEYFEKILAEIRSTPGVQNASSIQFLPMELRESGSCFSPPTDPPPPISEQPSAKFMVVAPGYFETMGTPVIEGREFTGRDRFGSSTVILVNRAFVQRYYPNENVLGKRLNVCWTTPNPAEIVGIVVDARQTELSAKPEPTIAVSSMQAPTFDTTLVVRSRQDPAQIARAVVTAIHRVNSAQPVSAIRTMEEVVSSSVARQRFQFLLMVIFAGMAVLLAALGVYGAVSYSVTQRTREIGIRIAVGASRGEIAGLVLKEGLLLASIGVIAGLACTLALTRFLQALLYEVTPTDPAVLSAVCGSLIAITAVAIAIPLRRATRVDPMTALRHE